MFGYVRPCVDKLSKEDKRIFQSYYCGICKSMAARYGQITRFALSYDCAFLALLADSLCEKENHIYTKSCALVRRKPVQSSLLIDRCADVNLLLTGYKLADDQLDTGKTPAAARLLNRAFAKAKDAQPFLDAHISEYLDKLWAKERQKCDQPDEMSDCFGCLLAGIMDLLVEDEHATKLAYHLGRYVYLLDAVDDYPKDRSEGNYNVFFLRYGSQKNILPKAEFVLSCALTKLDEQYRQLNLFKNRSMIDHIIYVGLIQYFLQEKKEDA